MSSFVLGVNIILSTMYCTCIKDRSVPTQVKGSLMASFVQKSHTLTKSAWNVGRGDLAPEFSMRGIEGEVWARD
jgi:hypothetical protein